MDRSTATMLRNVRIAAAYVNAFEAANGRKPDITYENGWFTIGRPGSKFRGKQVEAMTRVLESRVPA